jgi:hypothetical protein
MKRIALILISILYVISVTGIDLELHYCGGKVRSVSMIQSHTDKGCCEKQSGKNCCKTRQLSIKVNDSQEKTFTLHSNLVYTKVSAFLTPDIHAFSEKTTPIVPFILSKPPSDRLYQLHGVMLI